MRVFVTGATGFIGSAVVRELLDAGHKVLGLARSAESARLLNAAGAAAHPGDLQDAESLRSGAAWSDAVIHLGFNHDFSKFKQSAELDRSAIEVLGSALSGTQRPLIVTSGLALRASGPLATEDDDPVPVSDSYPRASEHTAALLAERGVCTMTIRLPQVHDTKKQGLVTPLIQLARDKGVSAYVGEGHNRWAAVHVLDAAFLYRLALETGRAGARYHAVAEQGIELRDIGEAIGQALQVPVVSVSPDQAEAHFGWFSRFVGSGLAASSTKTRQELGWNPIGPTLLADLGHMEYAQAAHTTA